MQTERYTYFIRRDNRHEKNKVFSVFMEQKKGHIQLCRKKRIQQNSSWPSSRRHYHDTAYEYDFRRSNGYDASINGNGALQPLCLAKEEIIREFAEKSGFRKQKKLCPYENITKRKAMEEVFHKLEELNPEARYNLWKSMSNIQKERLPE